ncbi:MAG: hydroxyacid dehydrogenase [Syntrophaceae bacterium]|nr:hydroxyacid dehydrogenase [Syntrophaceae bacterium]
MGEFGKKVIITTNSFYREKVQLLEEAGLEVQFLPDRADERFLTEMETAHALIPGLTEVSPGLMQKAPRLVIVAAHGVGYNNIDLEAADKMGILVTNIPGVNADAVAEFTLGLILALVRRIPHAWEEMRRGGWRRPELWGFDLRGKTLSIIGLGRIGSRVSKLGAAFGMEVLACDPYLSERAFREAGAKPVSREEAISRADFLTLHTPLTDETRKMVGGNELRRMKKSAFLINTARGGIVDDRALVQALDEGVLAGAGVDVFEEEPPQDPFLRSHPKIISTPHIAGLSEEARYRMSRGASERVACALRGQLPPDVVNNPENPRYLKMRA